VLKSTKLKSTNRGNTKRFITERYRQHIKQQLRDEWKYDTTKPKEHYKKWVDNDSIAPHSWILVKSIDSINESQKKHMIRMLHNALPTKAKIPNSF
jgi:hypothetical protein